MKNNKDIRIVLLLALIVLICASCLAWVFIDIIDRIWDAMR